MAKDLLVQLVNWPVGGRWDGQIVLVREAQMQTLKREHLLS